MAARLLARLCTLLLALCAAPHSTDATHEEMAELQVYGLQGSDVLIPGVETELQGEGVLEWRMEKSKDEDQWILTYHYGSNETEAPKNYDQRVRFSFQNSSLQLLNLTDHDTGVYVLQIKFKDAKRIRLTVVDPISDIAVTKHASSHDCNIYLECNASGEVWNITWKRNGKEVTQNVTRVGNQSKLKIEEGTESSGSYTCVAWNPVSKLECMYQLEQESSVGLFIFCFFVVAVMFGVPLIICDLMMVCHKFCNITLPVLPIGFLRTAGVCWFLCLISAIIGESFSAAYAISPGNRLWNAVFLVTLVSSLFMEFFCLPTLNEKIGCVKIGCVKRLRERCSILQGRLQLMGICLHLFVMGGSLFSMLINLFSSFSVCGTQPGFGVACFFAVVVPVVIVFLLYWLVRPDGPCSCCYQDPINEDDARQKVAEEQHGDLELVAINGILYKDGVRYICAPLEE